MPVETLNDVQRRLPRLHRPCVVARHELKSTRAIYSRNREKEIHICFHNVPKMKYRNTKFTNKYLTQEALQ